MTRLQISLEFVASGTIAFDPNVAVRDYDLTKVSLTINGGTLIWTQYESERAAEVLLQVLICR